ncbi:MAG: hypothetical protein IAF94_22615 [Pirellulaceae bacterium]|nr:hypothetical protein [Pirellulaceae bacterium]
MSLSALLPAAIPGLAVLSTGAARVAAKGLSFAATLADPGGASPSAPFSPSKQELPAELQKKLAQFAGMLREKLSSLGTSLSGPVELSADVLGDIEASGEQRDAQAVEQLLGQDQELSSAFLQLAATFNQAMGRTNAAGLSMPWDAAGAAQGVTMVVGEGGTTLRSKY